MLLSPAVMAEKMLGFYRDHGRKDLPWQQNTTPYRVWLSEIMLQQTQVKTVIPYYLKFTQHFPDITSLANADLDDVLNLWQGLGYYARARNLYKCAQIIRAEFNGEFPGDIEQLETLPGIGRSTAGAILSFSMNQSAPILDGNVKRILARVFMVEGWTGAGKTLNQLWQISEQYTPEENTAEFNQAMMDLGASLCSRSKPQCEICPLNKHCQAFIHNLVEDFPNKKPAKKLPVKEQTFLLITQNDQIYLQKQPPAGIWGGLWSLPGAEGSSPKQNIITRFKHSFTHFHLYLTIAMDEQKYLVSDKALSQWHNLSDLERIALPTPIRKFLFKHFQLEN
ncbi:MAG: A/G-specific adenine glycosylase [Gammaproteobacteria bacterium]|nr:A/G-specific adenine glycosylase [Gammaproteobacteria bacterium]MDH5631262.1 A/G-specific adenine glycosylase [Gammaproteobacteria bacterium]